MKAGNDQQSMTQFCLCAGFILMSLSLGDWSVNARFAVVSTSSEFSPPRQRWLALADEGLRNAVALLEIVVNPH
jgi:hypothetical protein